MGMPPIPPPPGGGGPGPTGPTPSAPPTGLLPAPAQPPSPGAMMVLGDINNIITSVQNIARQFPATVPIADQIGAMIQQLQMKILQSLPPTEAAAPPV